MTFDFYEQYRNYSNVDLLKIIKTPADYQAAAIEAATSVLKERIVRESEYKEVDDYFAGIVAKKQRQTEKIKGYKEKVLDFFQPVIRPTAEVKPAKWLNILLFVIVVFYVWELIGTIRDFISFINCLQCRFGLIEFLNLASLIYLPVIFILLYKRGKWGWYVLFGDNLVALIFCVVTNSFLTVQYRSSYTAGITDILILIFFRVVFIRFLWRKEIAQFFSVPENSKRKTVVVASIISVLFIACFFLLV